MEVDLRRAENGADVLRLAREAEAGPSDVVVVGGGDGTVGSVASILAGGDNRVLAVMSFSENVCSTLCPIS